MVRIRVPASSANLGPGFDSLGCALALYLSCEARLQEGLSVSGCPEKHQGEDNLIYRAFQRAAAHLAFPYPGLSIRVDSRIPIARGLGSSAAAILAGVAAAFVLSGKGLDRPAIFTLACQIEGHPDNVAAACFGGLTAAMLADEEAYHAAYPLSGAVRFTALIPQFELSTQKARAALPAEITLRDAAHNQAHSLLLLSALQKGDLPLIRRCLDDRWHEPRRLPLIPDGEAVKRIAESLGAACYLSGAGPTLMCLHEDASFPAAAAEALALPYPSWQALPLLPDKEGLCLL